MSPGTPLSRRHFLVAAATSPLLLAAARRAGAQITERFRHGVASGDPLADRVVLWTRVTPPPPRAFSSMDVRWWIADDEALARIVSTGTVQTSAARDFTVKVDVAGLRPGRTYYYGFEAAGERSPVGRTRTLPADGASRVRLAAVSCSNYGAGYFNVYRCLANREDLDLVLHLGDYIYEFARGVYDDGALTDRVAEPPGEAIALADYRLRYATYRSDTDLQEAHRLHPFVAVWDDHELANNAWAGGAENHTAAKGGWAARRAAAIQAYTEWMPIRERATGGIRLYRSFRLGGLADLLMLDTRTFRDRQVAGDDVKGLADPARTVLGSAQEQWLFQSLRESKAAGTPWRLIGQQVVFAPVTPAGLKVQNVDAWDGYPAARQRVLDFLSTARIDGVAVLTGDIHSSWAFDIPRDMRAYRPATGEGSLAVEIVTPAISSPPLFSIQGLREAAPLLRLVSPHLKYLEGESRGFVLIEVTPERLTADWHFVPTVSTRSPLESHAARFTCDRSQPYRWHL